MKATQTQRVLKYMEDFGSITQIDAMKDIGCMRLASRINDLKNQKVKIVSEYEKVPTRYNDYTYIKRYRIEK